MPFAAAAARSTFDPSPTQKAYAHAARWVGDAKNKAPTGVGVEVKHGEADGAKDAEGLAVSREVLGDGVRQHLLAAKVIAPHARPAQPAQGHLLPADHWQPKPRRHERDERRRVDIGAITHGD